MAQSQAKVSEWIQSNTDQPQTRPDESEARETSRTCRNESPDAPPVLQPIHRESHHTDAPEMDANDEDNQSQAFECISEVGFDIDTAILIHEKAQVKRDTLRRRLEIKRKMQEQAMKLQEEQMKVQEQQMKVQEQQRKVQDQQFHQQMLLDMEDADEEVALAGLDVKMHRVGSSRGSTTSRHSVRSIRSAISHKSTVSSNIKTRYTVGAQHSTQADEHQATPLIHTCSEGDDNSKHPTPHGDKSAPDVKDILQLTESSSATCGSQLGMSSSVPPPSKSAIRTSLPPSPPYVNSNGAENLHDNDRRHVQHSDKERNDVAHNENGISFLRDVFTSLQNTSNLPKSEIETFDGKPINFYKFMHNFDATVDKATNDNHVKLNYLIQFCKGEARESISDCVLMDDGYQEAREILRKRFGRPHTIAQTYLRQLTTGPTIKPTDGKGLQNLSTLMKKCILTLARLGYSSDMNSTDNLLSIGRRLPTSLRNKWAGRADSIIESGNEPTFKNLQEFIEKAARIAMSLYGQDIAESGTERQRSTTSTPAVKFTTLSTSQLKAKPPVPEYERPKFDCLICHQEHKLWKCPVFNGMTVQDRIQVVNVNHLCENCFLKGHSVRDCRRVSYCTVPSCTYKHNVLLHQISTERRNSGVIPDSTRHSTPPDARGATYNVGVQQSYKICMKVVPVLVQASPTGPTIATYALLDECSDVTLCSDSLASSLGVSGTPKTFSLTTVNNKREKHGKEITLTVRSMDENEVEYVDLSRVWTVDNIPVNAGVIPVKEDIDRWPHLHGVQIPELDSKEVTLLIGSDIPEVFWKTEEKRGRKQEPYAVKSILGWTVIGPVTECPYKQHEAYVNYVNYEDDVLTEQVERFWKTDFNDYTTESQIEMSVEDKKAYEIMENSVELVDGHYQVGLPWRNRPELPNNKSMAEARLRLLKKRFAKDDEFHTKYTKTINEYISKGYAKKVTGTSDASQDQQRSWYIPHHGVYNPQKPGKLRVVFDCAAKYNGTSLNSQLLQGPDYTNNLVGVFLRFRQGKVAVVGDIEGMFHQVKVKPEDCDFLKFLWWENGEVNKEPEVYQMTVHLFGATSSPSVCSYALRKAASDNAGEFDINTTETIRNNFYVDDCLKSVDSQDDAIHLVEELRHLLSKGGFRLTKWISNYKDVISSVPESERAVSVVDLDMETLPVERTLGVQWNVESDCFEFRSVDKEKPVTRRGILSVLSSLYDPLGFASPVVLIAKLILQKLCKAQLGWDESLDDETCNEWNNWVENLAALSSVKVPRWFKSPELTTVVNIELHHFADASSTGYGCVSYIRFVDDEGHIHCSFIMGKSRLAPIKTVTIPRLELSAAVVAVKMDGIIKRELEFVVDKTIFWTDSTAVIQYIENQTSRYKTFVANRLSTIHAASTPSQWRYVDTKSNPADHASRGFKATETDKLDVWLRGPDFLWKDEDFWPSKPAKTVRISDDEIEVKNVHLNIAATDTGIDSLMDHYSSWYALQKAVAWLLRFKDFCIAKYIRSETRTPKVVQTDELSVAELDEATLVIARYAQWKYFPDEMAELTKGQLVRKGCLVNLSPMLRDGVMRVGGRLQRAPLSDDFKHPIILPSKSHLTDIIVRDFHNKEGHSGVHHVLSAIRSKFWVVRGVATVKRVLSRCFICKRRDAPHCEQYMAPLPYERITPNLPPFTYVGVDFFGPMNVRGGRRTTAKRYGCLFTCLTTRAVHIEVAHALSTDSFICALNRFMARRGKPVTIYSDNGTNFKGGDTEIRQAIRAWNQEVITDTLRQKEIRWVYSPPRAPHFGGSWERLVRSTKRILKCLLSEQLVTDEALLTFMAEVEKILNDRPLTTPSQDSKDEDALTPNNLLLLKSNTCLPHGVFDTKDLYTRRRWRQIQYLSNVFWRRWIKEYLPSLQIRHKWTASRKNVKVGDVVLVEGEHTPRGQWPLGRVVDVFPDSDGFVRSVSLRVNNKMKTRPVTKLCMLESNVDDNEKIGDIEDAQRCDVTEDTERIDATQDAERNAGIEDAAWSDDIEDAAKSGDAVDVDGRDDITTKYSDLKKVNSSCGLPKVVMRRCAVADNLALSSAQPPVGTMHDLDTGLRRCPARIRAPPRHLDNYV